MHEFCSPGTGTQQKDKRIYTHTKIKTEAMAVLTFAEGDIIYNT